MKSNTFFIIDFDSTFSKVETLDLLCEYTSKDKAATHEEVKSITDKGMEGSMPFRESLEQRISMLDAKKEDLPPIIEKLKEMVSDSFIRNKHFFQNYADRIYIISSGFRDLIVPIVEEYGIKGDHVYANTFEYDKDGNIIGFDDNNVLSQDNGKVNLIKELDLKGDVYVIGDGYNDYEIKAAGLANKFYAFTENIERDVVMEKADHVAPSLDEFLYENKMNASVSYPKNRITVLLLENVHPYGVERLKKEGYKVEEYPAGLDEDELAEKIKNVSILGIRSKTQVSQKVLDNANRLLVIGAFCIGTNQIDLEGCLKKGVAVFNAPFSNTRSVVELVIGEIIILMRGILDKTIGMHQGKWLKSAKGSNEIRGKKLGIIGYGNIGAQLSVLAESMGMDVYFYDIVERLAMGNATKCDSMEELLGIVDVVTIHVDGRSDNKNFFTAEHFDMMKKDTIFINLSRGFVVDIEALKANIDSGKIRGASVDVFPEEPKSNDEEFKSELRGSPNTILTPHIGGSTQEAQENIAEFVPNKIIEYINTGSTTNSVNFPNVQLPALKNAHRLMHIHHNMPGILAKINNILAKHNINIVGQYLKTNETIGYIIIDIDKEYGKEVIEDLRGIENTIRFRVLY